MEWKIYFFISEIPDKNKFTIKDAIVGELPVIEEDSVKSEQFQIFNFLSNVRLPKFPDILNNMIRPQPDNQRPPPQRPPPQFFPSPQNNLNNPNHKIPNHQHQSSQSQAANEALTVFNQGLDNFIQNPASLAHVSRPVNGWGDQNILLCLFLHTFAYFRNNNAPFVLPPGMSVEDKTQFLLNLDKDHQAFVSMPHMNAGETLWTIVI